MTPKNQIFTYGATAFLLLLAIVCYAAFPVEKPEEPVRLMFQSTTGKVLFDHKTHTSDKGYGLSCFDCHHHPPDDDTALTGCGQCHLPNPQAGIIPESCTECHEKSEVEDAEYPNRKDAFHEQCMQCHEAYGGGPGSAPEDCSLCHVI